MISNKHKCAKYAYNTEEVSHVSSSTAQRSHPSHMTVCSVMDCSSSLCLSMQWCMKLNIGVNKLEEMLWPLDFSLPQTTREQDAESFTHKQRGAKFQDVLLHLAFEGR